MLLFNTCLDVCALAWETDNPDLSGAYANSSRLFEGVSIFSWILFPVPCSQFLGSASRWAHHRSLPWAVRAILSLGYVRSGRGEIAPLSEVPN